MNNKEMANIAVEAAKLRKAYPGLTIKEAIAKAKEMISGESIEKMEKVN
ncbi:hypothetical protein NE686_00425 [Tissierella carlieri]|uniref:Uncharacterized protein n=1 Tax=Tissierella carlieri TaxID=689904 RepID=A0ABT1S4Z3_9FIRM|nr:hypothetical protein [Tissierella carlieri]MCQ4921533.1 hypothetical protein [Tissierella carlieri]